MNDLLNKELTSYIDDVVDTYGKRSDDSYVVENLPYPEVLSKFASIIISYEDRSMECLYESKGFEDVVCSVIGHLQGATTESLEDLGDAISSCLGNYHKEDFDERLQERLDYRYDMDMLEAGLTLHQDKENGEYCYV